MHFASPVVAQADSRRGGRKVCSKVARWKGGFGGLCEGKKECTRKGENEERELNGLINISPKLGFNPKFLKI